MKNVKWLDNQSADGLFVLEMVYRSGGRGYLKNRDLNRVEHYATVMKDCPEVAECIVYSPNGQIVSRMSVAA